jgi:hypothetical protein
LNDFDGKKLDNRRIDLEFGEVDGRNTVLLGKKGRQLTFADIPFLYENSAKPELATGAFLLLEGPL